MRLKFLKSVVLVGVLLAVSGTALPRAEQQDQKHRGKSDRPAVATKSMTPGQAMAIKKFQVTASEGKIIPNTLRVRKGERVRITFVSRDASYGIKFKNFELKDKVSPEKSTVVEFTPTTSGSFPFRCTRTWGFKHWSNNGTLMVE
jgi:cytochrome c oxidase subunit 2